MCIGRSLGGLRGLRSAGDSHISAGPQQKGAEQQQEDGGEDLHQGGGVWWGKEEGTVQTICSDSVTSLPLRGSQSPLVLMVMLVGWPGPRRLRALTDSTYSRLGCRPSTVTDFLRGSDTDTLSRSGEQMSLGSVLAFN